MLDPQEFGGFSNGGLHFLLGNEKTEQQTETYEHRLSIRTSIVTCTDVPGMWCRPCSGREHTDAPIVRSSPMHSSLGYTTLDFILLNMLVG